MTNTRRVTRLIVATGGLTAVDLGTKRWATATLSDRSHELPGPVDLQLGYNTGTAFGLFSNLPTVAISIATVVLLAIVLNMCRTQQAPTAPAVLILAGGLGNLLDRLAGGGVIDMLHTGWWPTFNLADIFIVVGVSWWGVRSIVSTIETDGNQPAPRRTSEQHHA